MLRPEIRQQHTVNQTICQSAMQRTGKLANMTKACVVKTCTSKPRLVAKQAKTRLPCWGRKRKVLCTEKALIGYRSDNSTLTEGLFRQDSAIVEPFGRRCLAVVTLAFLARLYLQDLRGLNMYPPLPALRRAYDVSCQLARALQNRFDCGGGGREGGWGGVPPCLTISPGWVRRVWGWAASKRVFGSRLCPSSWLPTPKTHS